ncbi:hypothetical protein C8F04DRAFT_936969 [Mycena alexandri]|uniref:Uncharacterized protein n=1 Tax=Mycena alexandri TaxID=1745969 RepID=A0AAD6TJK8_9AGAR|nr:hypothetical protein C8F04DRAFT_936969 [Mycena alexandri]
MQTQKQQRRMTAPAGSSSGLQPPQTGRPPSPLRQAYYPSTSTGIDPHSAGSDDEDDRAGWTRSSSPSSSVSHVSQMAASFARSVGSLVNNIAPRSPGAMPTDAELEAQAERERDRSRREAERILTREAEDRRLVEERVFAMMESTKSLPPPPSRSQSLDPPSPSSSQKEGGGWWAAAKNKLTPTKELTPAQLVIQETKAREKEKKSSKGKEKEKEWPANAETKYTNPTLASLVPPPQRRPVPNQFSPTTPSPTPTRPHFPANMPPNLTPSPMRQDTMSTSSPRDREKEVPPLYAHFDETTGTLDVHVTLLTIAKRFEKLEKWTVGHVRALEERMGDVERWLVDKENEKEQSIDELQNKEEGGEALVELREGLQELQSRVSSLGREMAKLAVAPANLSQSTQAQYPAEVAAGPLTPSSSFAIPSASPRPVSGYTARESTSPPIASSASTTGSTRLPYPTGDYASPPDSKINSQDVFTASPTTESRTVSGLPGTGVGLGINLAGSGSSASTSYSNASFSPPSSISSGLPTKGNDLPLPNASPRFGGRGSASPTPRKRYTVALGGSVESDSESGPELGTAMFSGSEEGEDFGGDTIGKSAAAKFSQSKQSTPTSTGKEPRMRAQSAYGLSSILQASPNTRPPSGSRPASLVHGRSRSIDRFGTGNFVDPLVLRKQTGGPPGTRGREPAKTGNGKVPIGQLVAFFDGDRK